nr:NAD(P)H-dependent oxidoreductase [Candidatus Njordarchaeota archaeon]
MKSKVRLLAVTGSQRTSGNCYLLAKRILGSIEADYEIIQLAQKEIEFCDLCGKCMKNDCALRDDLCQIFEKMRRADGIVFVIPQYIFFPSKFLCFLERLRNIGHFRTHMGYKRTFTNPEYRLFSEKKPFCVFTISDSEKIEEDLKAVTEHIEGLGLRLILHDLPPFFGVNVHCGEDKGEVLEDERGIGECERLIRKLVDSIKRRSEKSGVQTDA